ncbi:hypothetical protein TCAP_07371, partial [Tolypocladium capitatum]
AFRELDHHHDFLILPCSTPTTRRPTLERDSSTQTRILRLPPGPGESDPSHHAALLPTLRQHPHRLPHQHAHQPPRVPHVPLRAHRHRARLLAARLRAQGEGGRLRRARRLGQCAKGSRAVPGRRLRRRRGRLLPGPDPQRRRAHDKLLQVHDLRAPVAGELRRPGECLWGLAFTVGIGWG